MILKRTLKKQDERARAGFILLFTGTIGHGINLRVPQNIGEYRPAQQLLDSQERLCFLKFMHITESNV